jgi:hypothetical protein
VKQVAQRQIEARQREPDQQRDQRNAVEPGKTVFWDIVTSWFEKPQKSEHAARPSRADFALMPSTLKDNHM